MGISCHIEVQNLTPVVADHYKSFLLAMPTLFFRRKAELGTTVTSALARSDPRLLLRSNPPY